MAVPGRKNLRIVFRANWACRDAPKDIEAAGTVQK